MGRALAALVLAAALLAMPSSTCALAGSPPDRGGAAGRGSADSGGGWMGGQMMMGPGLCRMGGAQVMSQAIETMGMMSKATKQMAGKLATGKVSEAEAKQMGQRLGDISAMMDEMIRTLRPQEQMARVRDRMSQMMTEMEAGRGQAGGAGR